MPDDGFNTTVTMDCGCQMRLNIQSPEEMPQAGWYYSCPTGQHSEIRGYDPSRGDPIPSRDRQVVSAQYDGFVRPE